MSLKVRPIARNWSLGTALTALPAGLLAAWLDRLLPDTVVIPLAAFALLAWIPWGIGVMAAAARREHQWSLSLLGGPAALAPLAIAYWIERAHQCGATC